MLPYKEMWANVQEKLKVSVDTDLYSIAAFDINYKTF